MSRLAGAKSFVTQLPEATFHVKQIKNNAVHGGSEGIELAARVG